MSDAERGRIDPNLSKANTELRDFARWIIYGNPGDRWRKKKRWRRIEVGGDWEAVKDSPDFYKNSNE